ncbi:penicillin-binding protein 1A [Mesonia phycicola]|uniref:Penicillin-binding protein 1A n=1 Tax=Mesonia phycicola TaxID=579105 RepID=A0A1M6EDN8_9FLAO|nr:transglycosylase domain-containing protein [Mesonia phycicola]SHI83438.1 penicillin-binding protein 1A [Mesonia phycicola]
MATKKATNKPAQKTSFKKYIFWFWALFIGGISIIVLLFCMASWGFFGEMPEFDQLENPETNLATEVFSSDGETLGKYYNENRTPIKYEDLPENLINALVATEDVRYYDHSGIDAFGTLRAFVYLGSKGGASTLSQQLAKQLFHGEGSQNIIARVSQKMKEWIIAVRLEENYTKQEILAMYFNVYDFNNNAVGVRSASRIYFGKEPNELEIEEAAVLAGMFKNSSLYNPRRNPEGVTNRRNVVLSQMAKANYITEEEKVELQAKPLKIDYHPESHQSGIATYFRMYLRDFLKDWAKENPTPDGGTYNIYRDGLKVYTSIDSRMQKYAEDAVSKHMKNLQAKFDEQNKKNKGVAFRGISQDAIDKIVTRAMKNSDRWYQMKEKNIDEEKIIASFDKKTEMRVFSWKNEKGIDTLMTPRDSIIYYKSFLNAGMMSMTPQTGEVKAWVGGINFKHFKYEHVKQAKRQVGSTFKPFLYATAIDQLHLSPCYELPNTIHTIPAGKHGVTKDWSPKNSGGEYGGMVSLKDALANSLNTISARLMDKVGPEPVIDLIGKLGVDTENIPPVAAIALGSVDLSVFEMVSAYSTFANKGVYVKPVIVTRIEDKNGTILYQHVPESRDVMSEEAAYVTINLMEGVTHGGSGTRLRTTWSPPYYKDVVTGHPYGFKNAIAGKTGTTQNQSDGWFMGIVPNLTTGVWVGAEDRSVHFPTITYGQGATMALPIWGLYMKEVYEDKDLDISKSEFEKPKDLSIEVDCDEVKENQDNENQDNTGENLDF